MSLTLKDPSLLKTQACIDAHWTPADSGHTFEVRSKATDAEIATMAARGTSETRRGIDH